MFRALTRLSLLFWVTTLCTFVLAAPEFQRDAATTSSNVDGSPKGFVTFSIVKKAFSGRLRVGTTLQTHGRVRRNAEDDVAIADKRDGFKVVKAEEPTAKHSAGVDQDGTDYSYFAEVKVGSEGKKMYMLLDTGASTTWIMGSSCESKSCLTHNTFGPNDSNTFNNTGEPYEVKYGTGSVRGHIVEDTLSLAGLSLTFPFGLADTTSDQFTQFPFDGILGLSISPDTWLSAVIDAKLIDANIFGVSLSRTSDNTNDGEISFGATDPDKYTGDITYAPVKTGNSWTITLDDVTTGGKSIGSKGWPAYIDTGTSFVFGPPDDVKALYELIPGSSSTDGSTYTIPCNANDKVAFVFSGQSWTVSTKDFMSPPNSEGVCTGNIYGMEYIPGGWLIGDVFLKNVYSVFDVDNMQIGFAAKAASKTSESNTTLTTSPTGDSTSSVSSKPTGVPPADMSGVTGQEGPSGTGTAAGQPTTRASSGGKISAGCSIMLLTSLLSMTALVL